MKKLLILILATVGAVTGINAQGFVGSWELFSNSPAPSKVIESTEYVYTLSGNSLSAIDKATGEIQVLNSLNRLNGNKVRNIWYNAKKKFLLVAYTDHNIDLVYDDGRTINVPDLHDATITGNKTINDVDFLSNQIYLALGCGIIIIDADHGSIIRSHIYDRAIAHIAVTSKYIMIHESNSSSFKYAPTGSKLNNFSDFKDLVDANGSQLGFWPSAMVGLNDNTIICSNIGNILSFDFSQEFPVREFIRFGTDGTYNEHRISPTVNGYVFPGTDNTMFYVKTDGTTSQTQAIGALSGQIAANLSGDQKNFWVADISGTGLYNLDSGTYVRSKARPQGPSGTNVGRIIPLSDGRLIVSTAEISQYPTIFNLSLNKQTYVDIFNPKAKTFQNVNSEALVKSMRYIDIPASDENKMLVSFHGVGLRIVDLQTGKFIEANKDNVAFPAGSATGTAVDKNGNLWIVLNSSNVSLMKAPRGSWETKIDGSKWSKMEVTGLAGKHSTRMVLDEDKGNVIVTGGQLGVVKMPEADKPLTSSTKFAVIDVNRDEDDSSTGDPWIFPEPSIDKNGWIWAPHNQGVFVIKDSDRMFEPGYHAMRPKVPRNDGTDLADYLLQQVQCTKVAVDENNQKWIGTIGSGLYRVSPAGDMILEHIMSSSSQMPSDEIIDVVPSKTNNDVYVGTSEGLAIYHSESSPASDSYDNVYAYPNPVTPDYGGYITIIGLMDDSLVKIADASGTIVHEGRSNGGMYVWNGCDASGQRVRSGVYFVFASQTGEEQTNAAVTKIIIVN